MTKYSALKNYLTAYLKKELAADLYYHGFHHTLDVLGNVIEISKAEKLKPKELTLLKIAVLLHDAGFTIIYNGHEDASCNMAKKLLPAYNISKAEIKMICDMIEATKIPQRPKTPAEKILADADLLYLGTDKFKEIGDTLFEEMKIYAGLETKAQWNEIQKKFLESHSFHTDYCKKNYEPAKQKNLKKVIREIEKQKK